MSVYIYVQYMLIFCTVQSKSLSPHDLDKDTRPTAEVRLGMPLQQAAGSLNLALGDPGYPILVIPPRIITVTVSIVLLPELLVIRVLCHLSVNGKLVCCILYLDLKQEVSLCPF